MPDTCDLDIVPDARFELRVRESGPHSTHVNDGHDLTSNTIEVNALAALRRVLYVETASSEFSAVERGYGLVCAACHFHEPKTA
jgi:hypothetical protein